MCYDLYTYRLLLSTTTTHNMPNMQTIAQKCKVHQTADTDAQQYCFIYLFYFFVCIWKMLAVLDGYFFAETKNHCAQRTIWFSSIKSSGK